MTSVNDDIKKNGWDACPLNPAKVLKGKSFLHEPKSLPVDDIPFPSDDPVVAKAQEYAKAKLPEQTYNHSMRVYYFGTTILKQQFADQWGTLSPSTFALTCLLHDIGTTDENIAATRMSFDLYGGIVALRVLQECGASKDQAEAVCEAIIRHQDIGGDGSITFLGQLIQLATIYDNVGAHPEVPELGEMIHEETRRAINERFPRLRWLVCFAEVIRREEGAKPWCNSTRIPEFERMVLGNELMMPFD
ncbi:cyanamide hydratase [Sodiomyces alkalinus F11]|uniref:Cyanamide hydratase n=1 Tax=Sodiomyces alkalinus (strain CBS 110278 / VKM F-3762 / F11) TaxID=1314773 RepID=A0A3N2PS69_SODAK|nr:cyanamide hydratase [Sodiomyces alkalinus F11]ROT37176.1 cyanamide hydratase [Sodiomyces alkalinus F11]